jgi:glycosyltransferase involved in cell wall biosynthesis
VARTVLFLHSSAGRYGADLQLLAIATGLDPGRYRPVCVLPERGELAALLEDAGVDVVTRPLAVLRRVSASPRGLLATARALARDRRELTRFAHEHQAAIVHSNTSVVLGGQAAARGSGARHVVHVREIYAGAGLAARPLWPLMRRRILRADRVLCISRSVAAQFGGASGVSVLLDGLPREAEPVAREQARAALGIPSEPFAVALVGRLSDWKGQDVLARALAEPALRDIGAIGLVAGDAFPGNEGYERELAALASELGVADRLRLLGFREDIDAVLGAADAVAVPSIRPEPLGLVALEAAAAGRPVVAAAHGGLAEVVRDGETGVLVPPGDHAALARALRDLADHPDRARRLAGAAAEDVRQRFGRKRMLAELQQVYDELLAADDD